jgi:hypothetical protein
VSEAENVRVERIVNQPPRVRGVRLPPSVIRQGVSMGMALAMVCSWAVNHSVGLAIVHGILSWAYVFYYVLAY